MLSGGKWVAVANLQVGNALTSSTGSGQTVFSIERVDENVRTYTFQVTGGTYVAGGIVVHNKDICYKFMQYPEP